MGAAPPAATQIKSHFVQTTKLLIISQIVQPTVQLRGCDDKSGHGYHGYFRNTYVHDSQRQNISHGSNDDAQRCGSSLVRETFTVNYMLHFDDLESQVL